MKFTRGKRQVQRRRGENVRKNWGVLVPTCFYRGLPESIFEFRDFRIWPEEGGGVFENNREYRGVLGRRPVSEGSGRVLNPVIFDTTLFLL